MFRPTGLHWRTPMQSNQIIKSLRDAQDIAGSLGRPSKMPCFAYGLPAAECIVGKKLRTISNSVCHNCYAFKGNYHWGSVQIAQYKRLGSITHPFWVDAMVFIIDWGMHEHP